MSRPRQVRLIAEARIRTAVIDATVTGRLYAADFLPEVWVPDQRTPPTAAAAVIAAVQAPSQTSRHTREAVIARLSFARAVRA